MDAEALEALVDELVKAVGEARDAWSHKDLAIYEDARGDVLRLIPAAQAITEKLDHAPSVDDFEPTDSGWEFTSTNDAALRLQGMLRVEARLAAGLTGSGPSLAAEQFHPWVWEAASSLWTDGHQRNAIHAAAAQIDNRLQAKIGREDISGAHLVREAFTLRAPEQGKARLRFTWLNEGSEAYRSAHEGALSLAAGCFLLIRNSAAHRPTELSDPVALEHLACLSFLARLIDSSAVSRLKDQPTEPAQERPFG